jgi:hypothetical protein
LVEGVAAAEPPAMSRLETLDRRVTVAEGLSISLLSTANHDFVLFRNI